jgi:hypothetical protein
MANDKKIVNMHANSQKPAEWPPIEDDGCCWIEDLPGGPFAVLPCNVCKSPVEIESTYDLKRHRVRCPKCGKQTPEVIGGGLLDVLKLWNEIVDPGEEDKANNP